MALSAETPLISYSLGTSCRALSQAPTSSTQCELGLPSCGVQARVWSASTRAVFSQAPFALGESIPPKSSQLSGTRSPQSPLRLRRTTKLPRASSGSLELLQARPTFALVQARASRLRLELSLALSLVWLSGQWWLSGARQIRGTGSTVSSSALGTRATIYSSARGT